MSSILIVEDEKIIAEDIKWTLVNFGYDVIGSVSEAKKIVSETKRLKPDLVLMDIKLGNRFEGIDAARAVKDETNLPVVFLTAYSDNDTIKKVLESSAYGYILKPYNDKELNAVIEMALYRHKMETAIKGSEKKYRNLVENLQEGIILLNHDGKILFVNSQAAGIFEQKTADMTEKDFFNYIKDGELDRNALFKSTNKKIDIKLRKENTEIKYLTLSISNYIDDSDQKSFLLIINDITALHKERQKRITTQQRLRSIESRFETILNNLPHVVVYETNGREMYLSGSIKKLLGYPPERFSEDIFFYMQLIHPDEIRIYKDKYKKWRDSGFVGTLTRWYRIKHKDGNYIWVEEKMVKTSDASANSFMGIIVDTTNIKKAEYLLSQSIARYKAVVEDQTELISRYLPDGKIVFVNNAYAKFFHKEVEYFIGNNWIERLPENKKKEMIEKIHSITLDNPYIKYETKETIDGKTKWLEWTNRGIFSKQNELLEYQSVARDITDRKIAEEEKNRMQKLLLLSQKMETVGRLAGGIAHDFNNLLMVINGLSERLLSNASGYSEIADDLRKIHKAGEKASQLVKKLMGFSRRQISNPKIVDVNKLLKGFWDILEQITGEKIKLSEDLGSGIGKIKIDPVQFEQIIINMVVNSKDAIKNEGKIKIKTYSYMAKDGDIAVDKKITQGEYVVIEISDNGSGISPENLERIFEPFFTTKKDNKGTGLGLSSVFGIVKQNKGFIKVESKLNHGTTFKFFFSKIENSRKSNDKKSKSLNILFVDDEKDILNFVKEILEDNGHIVHDFLSATKAISFYKDNNEKIDLVLTDFTMPEITGAEMVTRLKAIRNGFRVIFITGYADTEIFNDAIEHDFSVLSKPFTSNELIDKITSRIK